MTIKSIRATDDSGITFILDDGSELPLPSHMAGIIKERVLMRELRDAIHNILDEEIEGGYIDMDRHEYSREDFEEEVFCDLSEEIEYGNYGNLDEDTIREKITDTADFYELCTDE